MDRRDLTRARWDPMADFDPAAARRALDNLASAAGRLRDVRLPRVRIGHVPQDPDDTTD